MAEHHRAEHHVFGEFLRFGLDHQHGVGRAGDDEFEFGIDEFARRGIEDVLAVLVTDLGGADRALERRAAQRERGRGADERGMSPSTSGFSDITVAMIWTSFLYSSGNSGRIGRSIRREISVSFSVWRPSRLKKPPGMRPPA
jgi:hypothetical protein